MPAKFDETKIPGIFETIGYIDLRTTNPKQLAKIIKAKIGPIKRYNYFPADIDVLLKYLKAKSSKKKNAVYVKAQSIFRDFTLMSEQERLLLSKIVVHCCPAGLPDNCHLNLNYLERLSGLNKFEIINTLNNLQSLGFETTVIPMEEYIDDADHTCGGQEIIEIKLQDRSKPFGNLTYLLEAMIACIANNYCEFCTDDQIKKADFSGLSSIACSPKH